MLSPNKFSGRDKVSSNPAAMSQIYDTEYPSINDFSELSGADKHVHFTYKSRWSTFAQKCENPASTWYKITMTSVQTKMREMEGLNHFFSSSCSSRFFSLAMWKITPIRNQCNQNDNYDCSRNSPCDNGMICVICSCKRRKRKLKNDKYN